MNTNLLKIHILEVKAKNLLEAINILNTSVFSSKINEDSFLGTQRNNFFMEKFLIAI